MNSIHKALSDIKRKLAFIPLDIIVALVVCLVGFGAFALGWLAHANQLAEPIVIEEIQLPTQSAASGVFVGSRHSDKFHYRWCGGAARISPENKIYFATREAARRAGYEPAENCPGLQR